MKRVLVSFRPDEHWAAHAHMIVHELFALLLLLLLLMFTCAIGHLLASRAQQRWHVTPALGRVVVLVVVAVVVFLVVVVVQVEPLTCGRHHGIRLALVLLRLLFLLEVFFRSSALLVVRRRRLVPHAGRRERRRGVDDYVATSMRRRRRRRRRFDSDVIALLSGCAGAETRALEYALGDHLHGVLGAKAEGIFGVVVEPAGRGLFERLVLGQLDEALEHLVGVLLHPEELGQYVDEYATHHLRQALLGAQTILVALVHVGHYHRHDHTHRRETHHYRQIDTCATTTKTTK